MVYCGCCWITKSSPTICDPHRLQHARLPCPSLSSRVCSNSRSLSQWCPPAMSSCHPLLLLPSIISRIRVFSKSQLLSDGQRIGALASVLPMHIQGWFLLGLTGLISLQSKGLSGVFSNTTVQKHQFFSTQPSWRSNSHIHTWLLEKSQLWLDRPLLAKWCLCLLIRWRGLS